MSLVSQLISVSYAAVLEKRPANQWAESAYLRELERQGAFQRKSFGQQLEVPLDYRRNPGATFLATSLQPVSLDETEVISDAVYSIAELTVPVTWTKKMEMQNPTENQKVDLVNSLLNNGFDSHDDLIEEALASTSTQGFVGLQNHIPTSGQGTDGGIDASVETMWRCNSTSYTDDTDIEATFTTVWNACTKGSGSDLSPTMMVSDAATQATFESSQQGLQRYVDTQELKAGFKILGFKTARYVFSKNFSTNVYFTNPKTFYVTVSKDFYREKGETQELQNANGYTFKIYSGLQSVVTNRSRLGVAHL